MKSNESANGILDTQHAASKRGVEAWKYLENILERKSDPAILRTCTRGVQINLLLLFFVDPENHVGFEANMYKVVSFQLRRSRYTN